MAVFFDRQIQSPLEGASHSGIDWHPVHPILAVASFSQQHGGTVLMFTEEGELVKDAILRRNVQPSRMAWHPSKKVIAAGWESAEILVFNEHDREFYECNRVHKGAVTVLNWSQAGTRLISGDNTGCLVIWKVSGQGKVNSDPFKVLDCGEPICRCVFKVSVDHDSAGGGGSSISELARAAVSGDEKALDMFTFTNKLQLSHGLDENLTFFIAGRNGGVYMVGENSQLVLLFQAEGGVRQILYYDEKSILVTITDDLKMTQHIISPMQATEIQKVKLSAKPQSPDIIWAGKGVLAMATGESSIRMWDIENSDNYALTLEAPNFQPNETVSTIAFSASKNVLAGGTNLGNIALWKFHPRVGMGGDQEKFWRLQHKATVEGVIKHVKWGSSKNLLGVNTISSVFILTEQVMSFHVNQEVGVVQTAPTVLTIDMLSAQASMDARSEVQIKGLYTTKDHLTVWDGKRVFVYEIKPQSIIIKEYFGRFECETSSVVMHDANLYCVEGRRVNVRNIQGTIKQTLKFADNEGDPVCIDVSYGNIVIGTECYLAVGTTNGSIKLWDLNRREAKQHGNTKAFSSIIANFGSFASVKINCNGTRVSAIVKQINGSMDPKLYIWDLEQDTIVYFNFASGKGEQDDYIDMDQIGDSKDDLMRLERAREVAGRCPVSHYWNTQEPKLLAVEAELTGVAGVGVGGESRASGFTGHGSRQDVGGSSLTLPGGGRRKTVKLSIGTKLQHQQQSEPESMCVLLFSTSDHGILVQDWFPLTGIYGKLMGLDTPFIYFVRRSEGTDDDSTSGSTANDMLYTVKGQQPPRYVLRRVMRDFLGIEQADKKTKDAMMSFSYYITIGNMDEAFKAIQTIRGGSVWENMARMCVKTKRLDVAFVCLGNMGHARGARMLRLAMREPEYDARVAMLAVQLNMLGDAEALYKSSQRYDLLNQFYEGSNHWSKGLEIAEAKDRIHLRTTYYNYAHHLEAKGDIQSAIPHYEKSETHRFEVPRMLLDNIPQLQAYIMKTKEKPLRRWWAQYMESIGEMESALSFYEYAQDYLSLVRVFCYCGNIDKAAEIVKETGDNAAAYHLARQYENRGDMKEAIDFFTRAHAWGNAMRLCKENGLDDQMIHLALMSSPEMMVDAARYYETKPNALDKAVLLYHKAGYVSKAVELAFKSEQWTSLEVIASDLDENANPELVGKCAKFFLDNGQADRAVKLYALAKKYEDAIETCLSYSVIITEELAESMTFDKSGNDLVNKRNELLDKLADACMEQGQYHIATKKYTQAGNKAKAMRALLKSGDTEKIIFFANVSRQPDIYIMAANYMQTLDWRKNPDILKHIITFYTKARAQDLLAGFYESCAQVEIEEYHNYEKAAGALNEALKCIQKASSIKPEADVEQKLTEIKNNINSVKKFVQAKQSYDQNSDESMKQCRQILTDTSVIRKGDVYAFMIEHYSNANDYNKAYELIEEMQKHVPHGNISDYIDLKTIESIQTALGKPFTQRANGPRIMGRRQQQPSEEEPSEDIVEEAIFDNQEIESTQKRTQLPSFLSKF